MTLKIARFYFCIILQYKTHQKRHKMRPLMIQNNNDTHKCTHPPCYVKEIYPGSVGSRHIKTRFTHRKTNATFEIDLLFKQILQKMYLVRRRCALVSYGVYNNSFILILHVRRLVQIFSQQSYRSQFRAGPCCANLE